MPVVQLFVPCYVDEFAPEVAEATRTVLERAGCEVRIPGGQTCCGQPAFNAGYSDEARTVARTFLDAFDADADIVMPSGSCAAMVRAFYPQLFGGSTDETRAMELAPRTYELAEYLVDRLGVTDLGAAWPGSVTLHDGCHGLRELGIEDAPRKLLACVRGLSIVEMGERRTCCGFGGTFAVKFPDISTAMADVKLGSIAETGADAVVSGDVSCLLHLRGRARRTGDERPYLHLSQILASR